METGQALCRRPFVCPFLSFPTYITPPLNHTRPIPQHLLLSLFIRPLSVSDSLASPRTCTGFITTTQTDQHSHHCFLAARAITSLFISKPN
ncbi:hypothetical protein BC628DRAFT_1385149 [Trametes gibbosa]|nr:hypothetical protein BC628DRAFT_1385149 [Trametes gibbosa]